MKTRLHKNSEKIPEANLRTLAKHHLLLVAPHIELSALHDQVGNYAVGQLTQTKLTIGAPNDKYEREADHIAEQVMRMPDPRVRRQVDLEDEKDEELLQTKPLASQITPLMQRQVDGEDQLSVDTNGVESVVRSPGRPLDKATRTFMESRFGHDFGNVRVHTDGVAAESARSINAMAYTVGHNIAFGASQYAPETWAGQRLLAHELTHAVQQSANQRLIPAVQTQQLTIARQNFDKPTRERPGTSGELAEARGWDYVVYTSSIRLRYLRGEVRIGTIPWITNNPGNMTVTTGLKRSEESPLERLPFKLGAYVDQAFQSRSSKKRYAIFPMYETGANAIFDYLRGYRNRSVGAAIRAYLGPNKSLVEYKNINYKESHKTYLDYIRDKCKEIGMASSQIDKLLSQNMDTVSDEQLIPVVDGILKAEAGSATPGVIFSCDGFVIPDTRSFTPQQNQALTRLTCDQAVINRLGKILGCDS